MSQWILEVTRLSRTQPKPDSKWAQPKFILAGVSVAGALEADPVDLSCELLSTDGSVLPVTANLMLSHCPEVEFLVIGDISESWLEQVGRGLRLRQAKC